VQCFNKTRKALQKNLGVECNESFGDLNYSHNETKNNIVFDSTHKHYVQGTLNMLHALFDNPDSIVHVHFSRPGLEDTEKCICDIELGGLKECRAVDATFDIKDSYRNHIQVVSKICVVVILLRCKFLSKID